MCVRERVHVVCRTYVCMYIMSVCEYNLTWMCVHMYVCTYRIRFNFRGVKLLRITNFRSFCIFIFAVCDVIAHALPVWSKFLRDETFSDGY